GDAGDGGVVVLADVVDASGPLGALLTVDLLGEEVEGPRVGTRRVQRELGIERGLQALDLTPVVHRRLRLPDLLELIGGHAGDRVVRVDHHSERVVGDLDRVVADSLGLAGLLLVGLDRAGSVGDVGLTGTELLEAAAGARGPDGHVDVGVLAVEFLGDCLGERTDRARAVDADITGEVPPAAPVIAVIAAAPGRPN